MPPRPTRPSPGRRMSPALSIRSPRQIVHYMETRAAWSAYDAGGRRRHRHLLLAGRADPASPDVRAGAERRRRTSCGWSPRMWAAASGRNIRSIAESTLIAWATRKLRRGLRWTCERAELAQSDSHARDLVAQRRAGARCRRQVPRPAGQGARPTTAPMSRCSRRPSRPPASPR